MRLDPYHLTPAASLNRVRLASGPELSLPPHLEGKAAGDVLRAEAVRVLIRAAAERHGLAPPSTTSISGLIYRWLESKDADERLVAREVVLEHGLRVASLIAVLKHGEPSARAARREWDYSYWRHWSAIESVFLCGGLATAQLTRATEAALHTFAVQCRVLTAPHALVAPLIGVARTVGLKVGTAFVFDFGGTWVKRAIARYEDTGLESLELLAALPSPQGSRGRSPQTVAGLIANTIDAASGGSGQLTEVAVSLASYVRDNHPLEPPAGGYVDVTGIENLGAWLSREVTQRTGRPARVRLVHDGTASALSVSPAENTAAITLGTYLGVGFAREDAEGLADLTRTFRVFESAS